MKAITATVRNVTTGARNEAGEMVLRTLGDVTVTLEGMTRAEVDEWADVTDALNTRDIDEETFRLTVDGWKVTHGGTVVGLLFQAPGTRVHAEWANPASGEFEPAGWSRKLRHGAAAIVQARQDAGHGLPVDPEPEPIVPPAPVDPRLPNGTPVRYTGTYAMVFSDLGIHDFTVRCCDCDNLDCFGYQLHTSHIYDPIAVHVRLDSVTPLETAA